MNKTVSIFIIGLIILCTLPIFFITIPILIFIYNSLIKKKNEVSNTFSTIDVMLKKRYDLIPNLVASVDKIMTHEKGILEKITQLRSSIAQNDGDIEKRFSLENQMSSLLGQVTVTLENYPDIKSNRNILHLQRTLNEMEEQISASRRLYNSSVLSFNNSIQSIPNNLIAALLDYQPKSHFEANEIERTNPSVKSLFGS